MTAARAQQAGWAAAPIRVGRGLGPSAKGGRSGSRQGVSSMKSFMKCVGSVVAIVLLTGAATAAGHFAAGKVKGVNADKKEFVLTGSDGKDTTFKFGENVVINRGHKEGGT